MKHYLIVKDGGYFHRIYPQLKSTANLFDGIPERRPKELHGMFQNKEIDKGNYLVTLSVSAEISIKDLNINVIDKWTTNTILIIDVPKHIYEYKFQPGKNYILTPYQVQPL